MVTYTCKERMGLYTVLHVYLHHMKSVAVFSYVADMAMNLYNLFINTHLAKIELLAFNHIIHVYNLHNIFIQERER